MSIYGKKKMIWYVVMLFIGIAFVIIGGVHIIDDKGFFSGFGGALSAVAVIRLILGYRYRKDPEYAKKIDINNNDERILFVSGKAKSWAFYITVFTLAIAGMVLFFIGMQTYGVVLYYVICFMAVVYCVSYYVLDKKY